MDTLSNVVILPDDFHPRPYDEALAGRMDEAELSENCRQLFLAFKVYAFHTRNSVGTRAGYPDWHIIAPGHGQMWRELKRESGQLTPAQVEILDALHELGMDVNVWRPSDWFSGRVLYELERLTGRRRRVSGA